MTKIESDEELKRILIDILLSFHQFCTDHNIKYSLAAGTLIGAVRHKGFIPWDDDIDVYLLRDEYNKLISIYPQVYQDKFSLITMERDSGWHRPSGKLCDNRTVVVECVRNKYEGGGIGIDVFPVDDVPDDPSEWMRYEKKRRFLRNVLAIKTIKYSRKRSIGKSIVLLLSRLLLWPFSFSFLAGIMDKYAQRNNGKGYNHVYENCLGVYNSRHPWLKQDMEQVIDADFEGRTVKIMQGYDDYLTTVYGDYMKLPPEEKRVSHHAYEGYWK